MSEGNEGQHLQLSERLCKAHASPAQELLQLLLFILSNNLNLESRGLSYNREKKDKLVMQIFHISGLNKVHNMRLLLSQSDPTSEAVVERLFGSAMRSYDTAAIQLILEAGVNPNILIPNSSWNLSTPLGIAASADDKESSLQIAGILMAHGADLTSKTGIKSLLSVLLQVKTMSSSNFSFLKVPDLSRSYFLTRY